MRLTLIGMSNVGKSYWSEKLSEIGFKVFCCDDMIEKLLEPVLKKEGFAGIHDMSRWMGQPFDEQYEENAKKYIFHETQVLKEILEFIGNNEESDIVIDTTGSVIHTDNITLSRIRLQTKVIYLKSTSKEVQEMLKLYLEHPKPVYWSNIFAIEDDEKNMDALKRCYPKLVSFRRLLYNRFADKIVYGEELREKGLSAEEFLRMIQEA